MLVEPLKQSPSSLDMWQVQEFFNLVSSNMPIVIVVDLGMEANQEAQAMKNPILLVQSFLPRVTLQPKIN